jgi:hypothetical protein
LGVTIFGVLVAVVGNLPVWLFHGFARVQSGLPFKRPKKEVAVPAWITGSFERGLAYVIFYIATAEAYTVLIAWILAKLAANWQRRIIENLKPEQERKIRAQTLIALMAGTLSVTVGALGGAIARSNPDSWTWIVSRWC